MPYSQPSSEKRSTASLFPVWLPRLVQHALLVAQLDSLGHRRQDEVWGTSWKQPHDGGLGWDNPSSSWICLAKGVPLRSCSSKELFLPKNPLGKKAGAEFAFEIQN